MPVILMTASSSDFVRPVNNLVAFKAWLACIAFVSTKEHKIVSFGL